MRAGLHQANRAPPGCDGAEVASPATVAAERILAEGEAQVPNLAASRAAA